VRRLLAQSLNKSYCSNGVSRCVLENVRFEVRHGQCAVIEGRSGAGKTTLLMLLGMMICPDDGQIVLDDVDVSQLSEAKRTDLRASRIGFVFQGDSLLEYCNVLENVVVSLNSQPHVPRKQAQARSWDVLEQVGLADRAFDSPSQLSGGERQRVALARAFVRAPDLLLLDEPTSFLDHDNTQMLLEYLRLRMLNEEGITVIAGHDRRLQAIASMILTLEAAHARVRHTPAGHIPPRSSMTNSEAICEVSS
jgi:putative ABC transport system ATP-binding protein